MKEVRAVFKRELTGYFKSTTGWVLLTIFVFLSGLYFAINVMGMYSNMAYELQFMQSFFWVLIPILTMKTFAEERKSRTEILLFTSPASTWQIVLGKYLGCLVFFLLMTATTLLHVLITVLLGGHIDPLLFGTYIGFILSAAVYIAIGIFVSSLTDSQIVAAIVSVVIFVSMMLLDSIASMAGSFVTSLLQALDQPDWLTAAQEQAAGTAVTNAINWINPSTRLADFSQGIFELTPIVFLLSYVLVFLFLTVQFLERRRWTQR